MTSANSWIQYTASAKTQTLDSTEKSLQTLKALLQKDPKLETIISSPTLNAGDKSQIIAEITKPIASDKTVKNLLGVLAENNRLGLLRGVIDKYSTLMGAHKGVVEAIITSASVKPLVGRLRCYSGSSGRNEHLYFIWWKIWVNTPFA